MKIVKATLCVILLVVSNIIPFFGPLLMLAIILGVYGHDAKKEMKRMMEEDDPSRLIEFKVRYRRMKYIYLNEEMRIKCEETIDRWERMRLANA
jgi:hypothetical protein|nr:MAG TPA: hypothetical protein [Caudoviricetes sp.]